MICKPTLSTLELILDSHGNKMNGILISVRGDLTTQRIEYKMRVVLIQISWKRNR